MRLLPFMMTGLVASAGRPGQLEDAEIFPGLNMALYRVALAS